MTLISLKRSSGYNYLFFIISNTSHRITPSGFEISYSSLSNSLLARGNIL